MFATLLALSLAASPPLTPVSPRLINVTGEAVLTFPPNQVVASLPVLAKDKDVPQARRAMDQKVKAMLKALTSAGVDARTVLVQDLGVTPDYRGNEVVGQIVQRQLVVTLGEPSKAEETLTTVMRLGGVAAAQLTMRSTEVKAWETKARLAAAATARERATTLVETLGGKLGLPRSITDQTSGQAMATVSVALPAEGTLTIGSGDLSVTGLVSVQFDLRDEG